MVVMGPILEVNHPSLFRCYVSANHGSVISIGILDPEYPTLHSITTWSELDETLLNNIRDFGQWHLIHTLFESKSKKIQPFIQIAGPKFDSRRSFAYHAAIDNLKIFEVPKDRGDFSILFEKDNLPIDH